MDPASEPRGIDESQQHSQPSRDGLNTTFYDDQLSLARKFQEEFGSGSKKPKNQVASGEIASPSVVEGVAGELLNEDEKTVLPARPRLSRATESSLSSSSDRLSSSKAALVAEQKLGDFFPTPIDPAAPKTKYSDASLQQIANLLRVSHRERWSAVPRIYTVLRNIEQLQLIDEFIDEGFTDIWFPFTARNLPPKLSPTLKAQFLSTQSVVFTQALDLEKGEGRHATFAADEPLWFESRGQLGRGAFGVVDKVVSLITLQEYARKRMRRGNNFTKSKREIKEFKAELTILKTVSHQHCVKLVGSYTDPLYLGLIMDPVADCTHSFIFSIPVEHILSNDLYYVF